MRGMVEKIEKCKNEMETTKKEKWRGNVVSEMRDDSQRGVRKRKVEMRAKLVWIKDKKMGRRMGKHGPSSCRKGWSESGEDRNAGLNGARNCDSLHAKNSRDPLRRRRRWLHRLLQIATTKYIAVKRHQFCRRIARASDSIMYFFSLSIK